MELCLAADVKNMRDLVYLINQVGEHISILKLHIELIEDFYVNFKDNCAILKFLQIKFNFRIWEDRKLADIGSVMIRQIEHFKNWADIVSVHAISGKKSLESLESLENIDIILIVEMSTENNLMNEEYQKEAIKIAESNKKIIGVVSQHKITHNKKIKHVVPGISLNKRNIDDQNYNTPDTKLFADVFVIGRSIYMSDDPKTEILKYKDLINNLTEYKRG